MCGIAGIIHFSELAASHEIEAMLPLISHRGPDGEGTLIREGVALGHRRLAIIDLEGGRQPLCNEDEEVWITYNGELYNYRDLRSQLIKLGHCFKSQSDTEVIVHAYEEWGPSAVERFRGMFAFCIADFRHRRLFLARDHFGIKPLFVRYEKDLLAFASELDALTRVDAAPLRGRLDAIESYLRYRYIPGPGTIYDGIEQLPPGHWLQFDMDGCNLVKKRYWRPQFACTEQLNDTEWQERFDNAVRESVQSHLVSDVPFGVFLSGGVDSTLVAMHMSELLDGPITAFSIGFDVASYSELKYATHAAKELGIDLKAEIVDANVAELLPQLVRHYGQPYADTSMIPTWHLSRLARSHVPMVLSGDGGDEGFAGYDRYGNMIRGELEGEVLGLLRSPRGVFWRTPRIMAALRNGAADRQSRWFRYIYATTNAAREQLWRKEHRGLVQKPCQAFAQVEAEAADYDDLTYAQFADWKTYLPDDILVKVDIASMCHGLEVRTPLVDRQIFDLASSLPLHQRYRKDLLGRLRLKWLSKEALRRKFSAAFVHRTKMGFGIPEFHWLHADTPVRKLLEDIVLDRRSRLFEFVDHKVATSLLSQIRTLRRGSIELWLLLILGIWLEQNPQVSFQQTTVASLAST